MEGRIYTPGAGHRPPVLAGREELRRDWGLTCTDVAAVGRIASNDLVLVGPRGVGKTAALNALSDDAVELGFESIRLQAVRGRTGLVDSLVTLADRRISEGHSAWSKTRSAFARIAGVSATVFGVGGGMTFNKAGEGQIVTDALSVSEILAALADAVRAEGGTGLVISVDELQIAGSDLALLAGTLHRLNSDIPDARVLFAGTGLPNTRDEMVKAGVTHADRLFDFVPLPVSLDEKDARYALTRPALEKGITWAPEAVDRVVGATGGYPSHLQSFGHAVWQQATGDRITVADAERGIAKGAKDYERRTIGPRWEEMGDRQREYVTALAVLGGEARSADVSALIGQTTQATSQTRAALIESGDVYARPGHRIALAVPLSAEYALARYELSRSASTEPDNYRSLQHMLEQAGASHPGWTPPMLPAPRPPH